jgi:surface polysaccharide O-acyltransferase-like enzyme
LSNSNGITEVSFANRIQEIKERISGTEDMIEEIDTVVKNILLSLSLFKDVFYLFIYLFIYLLYMLLRKAANTEWNQPRLKKLLQSTNMKKELEI